MALNGHTDEGGLVRSIFRAVTYPRPSGQFPDTVINSEPFVSGNYDIRVRRSEVYRSMMHLAMLWHRAATLYFRSRPDFTDKGGDVVPPIHKRVPHAGDRMNDYVDLTAMCEKVALHV